MKRLEHKVALVTAAAQGIGKATAIRFASEGAKVIATDINIELLNQLKDVEGISVHKLDVTDKSAITQLAEEIGPIDILFNCAGFVHNGSILECSDDDWNLSFNINIRSMFWMSKAFLPKMIEQGRGVIINMSSVASSIIGTNNRFVYGTTKAAVIGLTKSLASDFVKSGIRAVAICPGTVDTPSLRGRLQAFEDPEAAYVRFVGRQPMNRLGSAEEVAAAATFLASDEAAFITGSLTIIDGGWSNMS